MYLFDKNWRIHWRENQPILVLSDSTCDPAKIGTGLLAFSDINTMTIPEESTENIIVFKGVTFDYTVYVTHSLPITWARLARSQGRGVWYV